MRELTLDQARRILLARQGLITPFEEPLEAVRAMVAVQTQYAASLPVAVAARLRKGRPGWEDEALEPGGALVKAWSVRSTLHTHLPEDLSIILGVRGERAVARHRRWVEGEYEVDMGALELQILAAMEAGPISRDELHRIVPELTKIEYAGWGADVMGLAFQGRLAVVGRGAGQAFALRPEIASDGPVHPSRLLRRYLEAFAPATLSDFAFWAGIPLAEAKRALEELGEYEEVLIAKLEGVRIGLPGFADATPEGMTGVRLLAKFDPLVLAHKDKRLILREEDRTKVFRIAGQVEAAVLSDGVVCATWRLEKKAKVTRFNIEPIRALKPRETGRLHKEAAGLAKRLGLPQAEVVFV